MFFGLFKNRTSGGGAQITPNPALRNYAYCAATDQAGQTSRLIDRESIIIKDEDAKTFLLTRTIQSRSAEADRLQASVIGSSSRNDRGSL